MLRPLGTKNLNVPESMFMALMFQQQKTISKLMKQIESEQKEEYADRRTIVLVVILRKSYTHHCLGNRNENQPMDFIHPTIEYLTDCHAKVLSIA